MVAVGYLMWTLIEYFGHRYLFHWEFPGEFGRRMHFLIHGVHHDHPNDPLRLVMPILLSGPIMIIAFFVATLLFGASLRLPALVGFISGYLAYDMVHYYTHHAVPTSKLGMTLRRLHLMHHFRDHDKGFGVSAPYWDYVFGTYREEAGAAALRRRDHSRSFAKCAKKLDAMSTARVAVPNVVSSSMPTA